MTIRIEPIGPDVWLTALHDGDATLGAYLPKNATRDDASLTIFWCGDTSLSQFQTSVERLENFMKVHGPFSATLFGYGPTKLVEGPISIREPVLHKYLNEMDPMGRFSAYRVEFEAGQAQISLWENVVEPVTSELEEGGDNVGFCTTPLLFDGSARTLILETIQETRRGAQRPTQSLSRDIVVGLLSEIAEKVHETVKF